MSFKSYLNSNENEDQIEESFGNIKKEMKEINTAISILKDKLNAKSSFVKEALTKFEDKSYEKWFKDNFELIQKIDKFIEDLEADLQSAEKAD